MALSDISFLILNPSGINEEKFPIKITQGDFYPVLKILD